MTKAVKKIQKALTDINPEASTSALKNFAQGLNNLTDNTYVGSVRVIKTDLDNPDSDTPSTPKQSRNIRIVDTNLQTVQPAFSNSDAGNYYMVQYDGTGDPYVKYGGFVWFDAQTSSASVSTTGGDYNWFIMFANNDPILHSGTITVGVDADDTYDTGEIEITLTGGEG